MSRPIKPILIIGQSLAEGRGNYPSPYDLPPGCAWNYNDSGVLSNRCVDPIYPLHTETLAEPITLTAGSPAFVNDVSTPPINSAVSFTGTLPSGLSSTVPYWILPAGYSSSVGYQISSTAGGTPVNLTDAGSGVQRTSYGLGGSPWPSFAWHLWNGLGGLLPICLVMAPQGGSSVCAAADLGAGNWDTTGTLRYVASSTMASALEALTAEGFTPLPSSVIQVGGQSDAIALSKTPPLITDLDFFDAELGLAAFFRSQSWAYAQMPFYCVGVGEYTEDPTIGVQFPVIQALMEQCVNADPFFKMIHREIAYMSNHGGYGSGSHPNQPYNDYTLGPGMARALLNGGQSDILTIFNNNTFGVPANPTAYSGNFTISSG